jgi:hypothetical protein
MKLLRVYTSPRKGKKLRAEFEQDSGRITHTDFGATGYRDYTTIADKEEAKETRNKYWSRHRGELGNPIDSPGMLSLFILWGGSQSVSANVRHYKNMLHI